MPAIIRKRTIVLPRLRNSLTKKPLVIEKPTSISDRALRQSGKPFRTLGRQYRQALTSVH